MNRILKQRARRLYGAHFGQVLLAYLFYLAYLLATSILPFLLQDRIGILWSALIQLVLMLLLAPLTLGVTRYTYLLHKERSPSVKGVLRYFTSPGRYGKSVGVGFVQSLPSYVMLLFTALMGEETPEAVAVLLSLLLFAVYGFVLYWTLHACLMPYILAEDEGAQVGHIRRESFRLMRGSCGRYFTLNLSFIGWYFLMTGVLTAVVLAAVMPDIMRAARMGIPFQESMLDSYLVWMELGMYAMMTLLAPYVGLANAGFGDAALQGRMEELAWQGRMPYGPQFGAPPPQYPQGQWYPPQYPVQPPQGGPQAGWGQNPGAAGPWQGQPQGGPGWNQPQTPPQPQQNVYTPAQQEEAAQYERYRQGLPMEPKSFLSYGAASDLGGFLPWVQVEQSPLYSFLKLEGWMPGMVAAAWKQGAAEMSAHAPGSGATVRRTLEESLSGTRFRVTVTLSDDVQARCCRVTIQIDLNPPV